LLPRAAAQDFLEEYANLESRFKDAAKEFLEHKYPSAIAKAEFRMGDLFDANDYPTEETLRRKFYTNLDIDAVAEAKDIRLNDDASILQSRVTKAVSGLWEKLAEPLKHFADTMGNDEAIFRDSTVKNLQNIVDMIPALNFTGDPDLEKIRVEIDEKIARYDPKDLRKNKETRAAVASEARAIMDEMAPFMNAFGGASA
jgi:hypothetical protein